MKRITLSYLAAYLFFDEAGQVKLLKSKVLLIGAGGLGSPAAFYLAAAGVGTLGIVDDDVVDRSNLQRQILHTEERVGMPKVESARQTLQAINRRARRLKERDEASGRTGRRHRMNLGVYFFRAESDEADEDPDA